MTLYLHTYRVSFRHILCYDLTRYIGPQSTAEVIVLCYHKKTREIVEDFGFSSS